MENKELVEKVKVVHKKSYQKGIKIEFESGQEKEAFIKNYFKEDNNKSIPIDVMGEMFLCNKNGDLCKNESKELIKQKLLKIQKRNDKGFLVLRDGKKAGRKYCVGLRNGKPMDLVYQLLEELIGFKKVIFTNGYEWILMQHQCDNKDFQCESLADFYSEPKDEETFAELQQHNFEQWLHLKLEINRIFKEAKSQSQQGEEKIGNDE